MSLLIEPVKIELMAGAEISVRIFPSPSLFLNEILPLAFLKIVFENAKGNI